MVHVDPNVNVASRTVLDKLAAQPLSIEGLERRVAASQRLVRELQADRIRRRGRAIA